MTSPMLVTGGTGTLGRHVVDGLRAQGRAVRVLSRHGHEPVPGVEYLVADLTTGAEIGRAVDGIETIIHLAGSSKGDDVKTRNLTHAAKRAGVKHLIYISVVGADRVPVESGLDRAMFGYFASKRAAERVVEDSGIPWTILRATQFDDTVLMVVRGMAKLPVIPVPAGFRFQPVDAAEVADRLVELALGQPASLVPDIAGPRISGMDELLRSYLESTHTRRLLLPLPLPGKAARAVRAGAILAPDRAVGRRTWEEFLADRLAGEPEVAHSPTGA